MEVLPLSGIVEVVPGTDLGTVLQAAADRSYGGLRTTDILVVTQKVVSKAAGRFVLLDEVVPGARARDLAAVTGKEPRYVEVVLSESTGIVRAAPGVLITRHRSGHVMANAGLDQSNAGLGRAGQVLLLPEDGDRAAQELRRALGEAERNAPAVVLADSFGRPWRMGVTNVAIGAAGLPALIDRRGQRDRDGRTLEATQIGFADLVASAAGLVMGEGAEGVPAAIVRGLAWDAPECPAAALVRPVDQDLFR